MRYGEIRDWTDTDFSACKPGVIVQHADTMRYAAVVDVPDHDEVRVQNVEGLQTWQLEDLSWYGRGGARVAVFGKVDHSVHYMVM